MRILILMIILCGYISLASAGSTINKNWAIPQPPTDLEDQTLYSYLNILYTHFNQAQVVTVSPNGNLIGSAGDFVIYNNAGTHQICFETAQPRGTTWKCANLT